MYERIGHGPQRMTNLQPYEEGHHERVVLRRCVPVDALSADVPEDYMNPFQFETVPEDAMLFTLLYLVLKLGSILRHLF